jgi:hypothetical protein
MLEHYLRRMAGLRIGALVLLAVSTVALAAAGPALAAPEDFAVFNHCPTKTPELTFCFYSQTTGGEFVVGNGKVPIKATVTLQGGSILNEETGEERFVEAEGAETLSKTPQAVPGGLLGVVAPEALPKVLRELLNKLVLEGLAGVNATAELVSTPHISRAAFVEGEGTAVELPIRIHLENPIFLGSNCYIGSSAHPVTLNLTTGTTSPPEPNTPLSGSRGELEFKDSFQLLIAHGSKLVDNAFAAPEASGCGGLLSLVINPAVNLKLGLPAAAGHNTAILEGSLQNATASAVKEAGY